LLRFFLSLAITIRNILSYFDTLQLAAGLLMCAWHDALAETLQYETVVKPTAARRKGNADKARAKPEMDV